MLCRSQLYRSLSIDPSKLSCRRRQKYLYMELHLKKKIEKYESVCNISDTETSLIEIKLGAFLRIRLTKTALRSSLNFPVN